MQPDLTIVIPTYNEEKRIEKTLDDYIAFFKDKLNVQYIISDHSSDSTRQIIKRYMENHKNIHLLELTGRGKGEAVMQAFKRGDGKLLGFTDADGATSAEEFYKLYNNLGDYDAIIGSRGLSRSNAINYNQSPFRRMGSLTLGIMVRVMFGLNIQDTQCGAKIFRREKILKVLPEMKIINSIFDVEMLWRFSKHGTIKELPIKWVDDQFSHFKWYDILGEFLWLIRVKFGL